MLFLQKKVKKPKSSQYIHKLDVNGANAGQKVITLTLNQLQEKCSNDKPALKITKKEIKPSQSSPQLQGAWVDRNSFIPVTTPEKKGNPNIFYCLGIFFPIQFSGSFHFYSSFPY